MRLLILGTNSWISSTGAEQSPARMSVPVLVPQREPFNWMAVQQVTLVRRHPLPQLLLGGMHDIAQRNPVLFHDAPAEDVLFVQQRRRDGRG